jgi:putative nucleotidyltransferase with HDIG domain
VAKEKILVVDDEENIRRLCLEILKRDEYVPTTVGSAIEALERARVEPFDLLLTDIRMPEMDGLQLLQEIREIQKELPAVIITGYGTLDRAIQCLRIGAQGFLVKPFTRQELLFAVDEALEKNRLMRENIRLRLLMPLFEISRDLLSEINLQHLLESLVKAAIKETKSDAVILMLPEATTGKFEIRAAIGEGGLDATALGMQLTEILVPLMSGRTDSLILVEQSPMDKTIREAMHKTGLGGIICMPLSYKGKKVGLLFVCKKQGVLSFTQSDIEMASILSGQAAIAIENAKLFEDLQQANFDSIKALAEALEVKDAYTRGHGDRLIRYAMAVAEKLGLSPLERESVRYAAILHDIGKIGVREEILNKPTRLTPEEYEEMKTHPAKGAEIVKQIKYLSKVVPLIYHHQERYDGKGYPLGLSGEQIPIGARIVAVLDAFDAMTSNRVYRRAPGYERAIQELKKYAGTQFDPKVVEAFLEIVHPEDEMGREEAEDHPSHPS